MEENIRAIRKLENPDDDSSISRATEAIEDS
jgi:hypothetical protein